MTETKACYCITYNWNYLSKEEKNALVAEKVMGWVKRRHTIHVDTDPKSRVIAKFDALTSPQGNIERWDYLGSMVMAMLVFGRHPEWGWTIEKASNDVLCTITIHQSLPMQEIGHFLGIAQTMSEAICIAALRAVGVKINTAYIDVPCGTRIV